MQVRVAMQREKLLFAQTDLFSFLSVVSDSPEIKLLPVLPNSMNFLDATMTLLQEIDVSFQNVQEQKKKKKRLFLEKEIPK